MIRNLTAAVTFAIGIIMLVVIYKFVVGVLDFDALIRALTVS